MSEPCPCGYTGQSPTEHAQRHNQWIAAKSLKDETLRASLIHEYEIRIAAIEAWAHGGPLPALGLTAQTILATAKYQEANREH